MSFVIGLTLFMVANRTAKVQEAYAAANSIAAEVTTRRLKAVPNLLQTFGNMRTVAAFAAEEVLFKRYRDKLNESYKVCYWFGKSL